MDQNVPLEAPTPHKPRAARTAARQASALLRRRGNALLLILTLLFAIAVTFAWLTLFDLVEVLTYFFLGDEIEYGVYFIAELSIGFFRWIAFLVLVMPVWIGRWRVAGMVALGKKPQLFEMLHYFTSWRLHRRAVQIALRLAFCTLLPLALCVGLFVFSFVLYRDIFCIEFYTRFANILLALCLLGALLVTAILFIATGGYALLIAVVIGNESLSWREARQIAFHAGWHRLGAILSFRLRTLLHIILSVPTLGILFLAYYAHHIILSYMRLAMALCPKGDPK